MVELRAKVHNKKLTISGGEPLQQYPAVLELLTGLSDFDIALYTGFNLDRVPKEILRLLRYVKVGRYIHEKGSTVLPYVGSSNQQFINLQGEHGEGHTVR